MLSRAISTEESESETEKDVQLCVDYLFKNLPMKDQRLNELKQVACNELKSIILNGWPESQQQCSYTVAEYWNVREESSVANDLVLNVKKSLYRNQ